MKEDKWLVQVLGNLEFDKDGNLVRWAHLEWSDDGDHIETIWETCPTDMDQEILVYDVGFEMSAVLESNTHGRKSYGWDDTDKIILFRDLNPGSKEQIEFAYRALCAFVDVLNARGIFYESK